MIEWGEVELDRIVRLLALLGFAALVFGSVFALLGRVWWFFELASHFMLPLAVLAVVVMAVFLWQRLWRLAGVTSILLIWISVQLVPYLVDVGADDPEDKLTYRFMALNLLRNNRETRAVLDYIEAEDPDVLLLQEVTPRWERQLRVDLAREFPYRALQARNHAFGIWLLSKLPLREVEMLPTAGAEVPFVSAKIDLSRRELNLIGVHPLPPTGQSKAGERDELLAEVGDLLGEKKGARMVLGDLNCTPWSPYFRKLLREGEVRDSGRWRGWAPTWNPGISLLSLPIDHCLLSEELGMARREVGPEVGSDHRGVVVEVFWR